MESFQIDSADQRAWKAADEERSAHDRRLQQAPADDDRDVLTNRQGHPVHDNQNLPTIGDRGPATLENDQFLEKVAHFADMIRSDAGACRRARGLRSEGRRSLRRRRRPRDERAGWLDAKSPVFGDFASRATQRSADPTLCITSLQNVGCVRSEGAPGRSFTLRLAEDAAFRSGQAADRRARGLRSEGKRARASVFPLASAVARDERAGRLDEKSPTSGDFASHAAQRSADPTLCITCDAQRRVRAVDGAPGRSLTVPSPSSPHAPHPDDQARAGRHRPAAPNRCAASPRRPSGAAGVESRCPTRRCASHRCKT